MTCREKLQQEHPEYIHEEFMGGCKGCPHRYGYLDQPHWCAEKLYPSHANCDNCWDREIPGTENTEKESNTMETTTAKKTKAQLIEEINELKAEVAKLDKYKQYEEMADEMFAIKSSLINAGFNDSEAFTLMIEMIKTAGKVR